MKSTRPLLIEPLEDRTVPTVFGNPWLDGEHLTLSFAPDGTTIGGQSSNLNQLLSSLGSNAAKLEILTAFQTWAVQANLNIGLVSDGGQSFGTGGSPQGDTRFGDIRIGAANLGSDVLAFTSPFNYFNTYSGNLVLNNTYQFGLSGSSTIQDLRTVILHEAGHALGLGESTNSSSVRYDSYVGTRRSLAPIDITEIQSLYGVRIADPFEGSTGNDSRANATKYTEPVEGDITSLSDVDYYRFQTSLLNTGVTIKFNAAGMSLLNAKVSVVDANGNIVASTQTLDPLNNNLTLSLENLRGLSTYFVKVEGARDDVFGIGSYKLSVDTGTLSNLVSSLVKELGLNDTLFTATKLVSNVLSLGNQVDYTLRASLSAVVDLDYYRVHSPKSSNGLPTVMVATVWGLDGSKIDPRLRVYDSAGKEVAAQILSNDDGTFALQIVNAKPDSDYFVRVSSDSGRIGNYDLSVDFRTTAVTFDMGAKGTLSKTNSSTSNSLNVTESQMVHLVLSNESNSTSTDTVLQLIIRDINGQIVYRLTTTAGDAKSADLFLEKGLYTVEISALSTSGSPIEDLSFRLDLICITDPVGARPTDPSSTPSGTNSTSTPSSTSKSTSWGSSSSGDSSAWF